MEMKIEKFWLVIFIFVIFFNLILSIGLILSINKILSNAIYEISAYGTGDGKFGYYRINKFTGEVTGRHGWVINY